MTGAIADLAGVRTIPLRTSLDERGALTSIEGEQDIPFAIERIFYVHGVQPPFERGGHAHLDTQQLLVSVAGALKIDLSDGRQTRTYSLSDPTSGLYIPQMIWGRLYDFSREAVCLAAASTHYEPSKVIRRWEDYLRLVGRG